MVGLVLLLWGAQPRVASACEPSELWFVCNEARNLCNGRSRGDFCDEGATCVRFEGDLHCADGSCVLHTGRGDAGTPSGFSYSTSDCSGIGRSDPCATLCSAPPIGSRSGALGLGPAFLGLALAFFWARRRR